VFTIQKEHSMRSAPSPGVAPTDTTDPRAALTQELLDAAVETDSETERQYLLERVVVLNMAVARSAARRYYDRGIPAEDLDQVAYMSLVAAAQRYRPGKGNSFLAFAMPTIKGELRRHFRDRGWVVRPPRRVQDAQREVQSGVAHLTQTHGRSPTAAQLAEHLGMSEDDVIEALATQSCFRPMSLDREITHAGEEVSLIDVLPDEGAPGPDDETRVMLRQVVRSLPERDRRIVGMRFYRDLTQQEIAQDVGLSQMQVSRILTRVLGELRELLTDQAMGASA
jgi:RNA polymerase sigma-B factor